jgi:bifunctional enzyme CysN/CysC
VEQGKTEGLPGVDLEYEIPTDAMMVFNPEENEKNLDAILDYLAANKIFPAH